MVMQIKFLRERAQMSQQQLAEVMGTTQTGVSNWENEVSLPRTRELPKLAAALGCTIDDLYRTEPAAETA